MDYVDVERIAAFLHDEYGCRMSCRGGRLANDGDPSHVAAYMDQAERLAAALAIPEERGIDRETLARAMAEAQDTQPESGEPLWDVIGEAHRNVFRGRASDLAAIYDRLAALGVSHG